MESLFRKSIEDIDEFRKPEAPLGVSLGDPFGDAGFDMEAEDREADAVERRFSRGELLQNLDAQAWLLHHPPDAAHLAFDAIETCDDSLLLRFVQHVMFFLWLARCRTLYLSPR